MLTSGYAERVGLTDREHRLLITLGLCTLLLALSVQWSLYGMADRAVSRPDRCGSLHMSCEAVRSIVGD
jgi:hypothetical protein